MTPRAWTGRSRGAGLFALLGLLATPAGALAAAPAVDLDQIRNGSATSPTDPGQWQNGNLNATQAHYVEGWSTAYRAIMTDLPVGQQVTLTLGYDIKHSDTHALDYLTHFDRLEPHLATFGHDKETIDPLTGTGVSPAAPVTTFPIPAPSSAGSPVPGQPATSFAALPAGGRVMTLWNGTLEGIAYVTEGDLADDQDETRISVTFTPSSATAVLAWGGHIASRMDWGFHPDGTPLSAAGINGSPYHMRLIGWTLGNLGQQDRSLAAAAVFPPPMCDITGQDLLCAGDQAMYFASTDDPSAAFQWSFLSNSAGAQFVGSTTDSVVTVATAGAGSFELQLSISALSGTSTCDTLITVGAVPTADAGADQAVCTSPGLVIQLAGSIGGGAGEATWNTSGSGTFGDPSSPVTTYTPSAADVAAGTVTLVLATDDPAGPCPEASDEMVLTITPSSTVDAGSDRAVCSNPVPVIQLAGAFGGGAGSAVWSTSGTGAFDDPTDPDTKYHPSAADIAAGGVTLTLTTDDPAGPCGEASDSLLLTIAPAATVDAGPNQAVCSLPPPVIQLAGSFGGGATGASWTTDGTGIFDDPSDPGATYTPSAEDIAAGTVTLTLTTDDPTGPCGVASDGMMVMIRPAATVSAGADQALCALPAPVVQLAGSFGGGAVSVTWTTSGTGTFADATDPATTYTPSAQDIANGGVTLTLTTDNPAGVCGAVSDALVLTISAAAVADAGEDQAACAAPVPVFGISGSVAGSAGGGTWSTSGTGTFGDANALETTYTPSAADIAAGSVTLTLATNDPEGPCGTASDDLVLTIHPQPSCELAYPDVLPFCGSIGNELSGPPGMVEYVWTVSGNGELEGGQGTDTITYGVGPALGVVHITLTMTDPNGCEGTCVIDLHCVEPGSVLCSFTQGFWGNAGGKFNGQGTLRMIEGALMQGPLVLGGSGRSVSVPLQSAACILMRLPAGVTPTTLPAGLGDQVLDAQSCQTSPAIPVDANGKWENILLGQTTALSLNVRIDPDLAGYRLCPTFTTVKALPGPDGILGTEDDVASGDPDDVRTWTIPQEVLQALGMSRTVADLLVLANSALAGNEPANLISPINQAVSTVNEAFDQCAFVVDDCRPRLIRTPDRGPEKPASGPEQPLIARGGAGTDLPSEFALHASRPNPVRGAVEIRFDLPAAAAVSLEIYDVAGRRVRVLENGSRPAGRQSATWDARDDSGLRVAAGIYFYRLSAGEHRDIRKMVVLR